MVSIRVTVKWRVEKELLIPLIEIYTREYIVFNSQQRWVNVTSPGPKLCIGPFIVTCLHLIKVKSGTKPPILFAAGVTCTAIRVSIRGTTPGDRSIWTKSSPLSESTSWYTHTDAVTCMTKIRSSQSLRRALGRTLCWQKVRHPTRSKVDSLSSTAR